MMEGESFADHMAKLSYGELADIVGPLGGTYRPEAVAAAEAELAMREPEETRQDEYSGEPTAESSDDPRQREGIGGWLGVLVGLNLFVVWGDVLFLVTERRGVLSILLGVVFCSVNFFVLGLGLNYRWPNAVRRSILVLRVEAWLVMTGVFLLSIEGKASDALRGLVSVFVAFGWIAYLQQSWRVYNTYPDWRQFIETRASERLRERFLPPGPPQDALMQTTATNPSRGVERTLPEPSELAPRSPTGTALTSTFSERTSLPDVPTALRLDGWTGGAIRQCPECGLGNPERVSQCRECNASLSGTIPFTPSDCTG